MPGPLILGAIIDSACRVWQEACGAVGACWIYTPTDMGVRIFVWWLLVKAMSIVCYFLAQFFYRPPPEPPIEEEQKEGLRTNNGDQVLSALDDLPGPESNV
nr:hypothetical protein BaRGS_024334 [Batillaria attramentaria]